jgi:hypothetical protein
MVKTTVLLLMTCGVLVFASAVSAAEIPLSVQAYAAQGFAAPGNNQAANFLVIVTNPQTGAAVTNLIQSNFTIINHFGIPGQVCGFSNGVVSFHNIGTGAYQIQVKVHNVNPSVTCTWIKGDYLGQVMVTSAEASGQTPVKLSIQ